MMDKAYFQIGQLVPLYSIVNSICSQHPKMSKLFSERQQITEVCVYLRNRFKRALKVKVQNCTSANRLRTLVEKKKVSLNVDEVMLFIKGKQVYPSDRMFNVKQKDIIHVVDLKKVAMEEITIHVKELNNQIQPVTRYQVLSSTTIREFMSSLMSKNIKEYFLVCLGKALDYNKSFKEQFVQHQTELQCVPFKQNNQPQPAPMKEVNETSINKQQEQQNKILMATALPIAPIVQKKNTGSEQDYKISLAGGNMMGSVRITAPKNSPPPFYHETNYGGYEKKVGSKGAGPGQQEPAAPLNIIMKDNHPKVKGQSDKLIDLIPKNAIFSDEQELPDPETKEQSPASLKDKNDSGELLKKAAADFTDDKAAP